MNLENFTQKLNESLFPGDLRDLVSTTVSLDEFESKVDEDAVVLAFSCTEEEPAKDLNNFIEFGPNEVLDTEVSPAPDEDGNYLVFVEIQIKDNKDLAQKVYDILDSVKYLIDNKTWKFQTRFGTGDLEII